MKSLTFFKWAAGLLLILNLGLLAFMFFRPLPPGHAKPMSKKEIQKHLNLTEGTFNKFHASVQVHRGKMEAANAQQKEYLKQYFDGALKEGEGEFTERDSLLTLIGKMEAEKVKATEEHFNNVGDLVGDNYQEEYREFVEKTVERLLLLPEKRGKHPRSGK